MVATSEYSVSRAGQSSRAPGLDAAPSEVEEHLASLDGKVVWVHPRLQRNSLKGCQAHYTSKGGFRQHMLQHRARGDIVAEGPIDAATYKRKVGLDAGGRATIGPCGGTPLQAAVSRSGVQNGEAESQEGTNDRQSPAALASCKGAEAAHEEDNENNSLPEPPPELARMGSSSRMSSEDECADWPVDLRDMRARYEHSHLQHMQDLSKLLSAQEAVRNLKRQCDQADEEASKADRTFLRNQKKIRQEGGLAKEMHEKSLADLQQRKERSASAGTGLQQCTANVGCPNSTRLTGSMEADTEFHMAASVRP
ncbi:hypothetical protein WJX73_000563 [Symbiochloris irregularis]|uniref:C2H2-type domain-containing protein n=1 Tax=Symbiochloris irregularis TaxID=706552 RepID=A0AAW1NP21_9CHLO